MRTFLQKIPWPVMIITAVLVNGLVGAIVYMNFSHVPGIDHKSSIVGNVVGFVIIVCWSWARRELKQLFWPFDNDTDSKE